MKQFQFDYHSITSLKRDLDKISLWCKSKIFSHVVFQIYSDSLDRGQIDLVCDVISQNFPNAIYMGCSTNGNIVEGRLSSASISVICTIFEYPTTKLKLLQYTLNSETALDVVEVVKKEIKKNPWVKAVEMQLTIRGMSLTPFCDAFKGIEPSVAFFGGGAFNPDLNRNDACVFSNVKGYSEKGVIFLLMGGEDFNVYTTHITGWKPLGREFQVTKAKNAILYELDGKPAYDAYHRYLNILKDEHFFNNSLEFPFFYSHHGINILRAPIACNEDGSLVMTADIDENVKARLAYGDPWTILASVRKDGKKIGEFNPEIIKVFSCAARRTFWGKEEISSETLPLQSLASTSGFYTSGEFLRTGEYVNQHNVTLVVAAMREGKNGDHCDFDMEQEAFSGKVSMINRLATFIDAATQELAEANQKLSLMAITDPLSSLFNRGEIQRRINKCVSEKIPGCLVMLDIDNFKQINEMFGHQEGDYVIKGISYVMRKVVDECGLSGANAHNETFDDIDGMYADTAVEDLADAPQFEIFNVKTPIGRWGGEEFMALLHDSSLKTAVDFANRVRIAFNDITFEKAGRRSVSVGVTELRKGESADTAIVRVDKALYRAKKLGKNRVAASEGENDG
ncbi:diguanylate cyclase [Fibrobacter sp.]|uniref:sensor domain-containing diguanylate cyclase n=1 Tax=Fibrobacter sp. TaxID=35828 RepID=UPI0026216950|nr:diguanylate cyclase [Fibrobacter sp.]MDD5941853.1 diguanylate cyclase [Fibrobacter sp.]